MKAASRQEIAMRREASRQWLEKIYLPLKSRPVSKGPPEIDEFVRVVEGVFQRIAEHPDETCSDRCTALGIDAATESATRRDLGPQGRGLIEPDGKVGNLVFFRATAKGKAVATQKGYKVWKSHASPTHSWLLTQCLKGLGRAGPIRMLGRRSGVGGRRPDGLVGMGDRCIALQVCSSGGNYQREAKALIGLAEAPGIDLAVLVGTHKRHTDGARKALSRLVSEAAWETLAVLDASEALKQGFDWREVVGDE